MSHDYLLAIIAFVLAAFMLYAATMRALEFEGRAMMIVVSAFCLDAGLWWLQDATNAWWIAIVVANLVLGLITLAIFLMMRASEALTPTTIGHGGQL